MGKSRVRFDAARVGQEGISESGYGFGANTRNLDVGCRTKHVLRLPRPANLAIVLGTAQARSDMHRLVIVVTNSLEDLHQTWANAIEATPVFTGEILDD